MSWGEVFEKIHSLGEKNACNGLKKRIQELEEENTKLRVQIEALLRRDDREFETEEEK